MSRSDPECRKDNGRPADRVARVLKRLLTEAETLQQLVILGHVMPFDIIEEFAAAAGHLEEATAAVEVLAMRAQVLGQVIDPGGEQRDLDFGRSGILLVGFVFGDDLGFNDCRHGLVDELHDCRGPLQAPCHPPPPRG